MSKIMLLKHSPGIMAFHLFEIGCYNFVSKLIRLVHIAAEGAFSHNYFFPFFSLDKEVERTHISFT